MRILSIVRQSQVFNAIHRMQMITVDSIRNDAHVNWVVGNATKIVRVWCGEHFHFIVMTFSLCLVP